MDTIGRSTLKLTALNVVDDFRGKDLVVTYDYPFLAGFRKPIVIFTSLMGTFGVAYLISRLDVVSHLYLYMYVYVMQILKKSSILHGGKGRRS